MKQLETIVNVRLRGFGSTTPESVRTETGVPERVYPSAGDGSLEAFDETLFPTEDELEALIAETRNLSTASRAVPETRAAGSSSPARSAALRRWVKAPGGRSIDYLITDQDAVPTLAVVKRGLNPEILRTIVGQILEYTARSSYESGFVGLHRTTHRLPHLAFQFDVRDGFGQTGQRFESDSLVLLPVATVKLRPANDVELPLLYVERVDGLLTLVFQKAEDVHVGDAFRWVQFFPLSCLGVPSGRSLGDVEADPGVILLFPRLDVGRTLDFDRPAARYFDIERTPLSARFLGLPQCVGYQELGQNAAPDVTHKIGSRPSPVVLKREPLRLAPRMDRLAA